jgi:hypothetical protein
MSWAAGIDELAWVVLRAVNRTQAKGSTVRLIVPRVPEVANELGVHLGEDKMLTAEDYLLERGYIVPVDIGLTKNTFTITPAGLRWLERSPVTL